MEAIAQRLREDLASRPEILFAILFGSAATGRLRARSDIDLAVRFAPGRKPEGWDYGGFVASLEAALGRRVDLVDVELATSTVLRFEIAKGVQLKGETAEWVRFKVRAFRDWREFGPRFRRCARAMAAKLASEEGVRR